MSRDISSSDDVIDLRDVTDRVEELREELQEAMDANEEGHSLTTLAEYVDACRADVSAAHAHRLHDEAEELHKLEALLADLCGYGGDHQWEGDWYPGHLTRDSHFRDYAEELAEDCGLVTPGASWPNNCIDWDAAAVQLQVDYSSVDFDGVTYWYR